MWEGICWWEETDDDGDGSQTPNGHRCSLPLTHDLRALPN
jgi:hypothetical protein